MAEERWVCLLRGVNVGGKGVIEMAALTEALSGLGLVKVRSVLQSGNLLFDAPQGSPTALTKRIEGLLSTDFGVESQALILPVSQLLAIRDGCPFLGAGFEPNRVQLFCAFKPIPVPADEPALDALRASSERYVVGRQAFYLAAPDGVWKSKLAAKVERVLGVPLTARNLRTVSRILDAG